MELQIPISSKVQLIQKYILTPLFHGYVFHLIIQIGDFWLLDKVVIGHLSYLLFSPDHWE